VAKRPTPRRSERTPSAGRKLDEYRRKRDFDRTAEPAGPPADPGSEADAHGAVAADGTDGGGRFVVQRHRARRLHYDLRLEVDGTLASWAVPKGPTLDPSVRSLAVHVEDHPLEYADFEGVIPSGEYGGGDVIVWDRGTWRPSGTDDPAAAIAAGELHFDVTSEKLAGRFVLVRTDRGGSGGRSAREQWLLLHKHDEHARQGWNPENHPRSVRSGRTNDEVAADPEALWRSDLPADRAEVALGTGGRGWEAATRRELDALDGLADGDEWTFQDLTLTLAGLDTLVVPAADGADGTDGDASGPITRRDLVRHHVVVAPALLPYLAGRPVDVLRFPRGIDGRGSWRTGRPRGAPAWLEGWRVDDEVPGVRGRGHGGWRAVFDSPASLAWMAADGAVELHPWPSRVVDLDRPTWAFLGVEAGGDASFGDVVEVARLVGTALDHLHLDGRPVASGTGGIEVWIPILPGPTFRQVRTWVRSLARAVAGTLPDLAEPAGSDGENHNDGKVRLAHALNAADAGPAAPWTVRAEPGAAVVVPLGWDELDDPDLRPGRWTVRTARERLDRIGDPLAPIVGLAQDLPPL
jgi:bifunctional non-homologous end joining protein LigD